MAVEQNTGCFYCIAVKNYLMYEIIFRLHGFQSHHSPVILTACMLTLIHYTVYLLCQVSTMVGITSS